MLRIYPVSLTVYRDVCRLAETIAHIDREQARQLRRSCLSIHNNLSEGSGGRAGTRRSRYLDSLGSARETLANLEAAEIAGHIAPLDPSLRRRFDHIIGTLVRILF